MPYGYTGQNLINQTVKNSGVFSISDVADLEKQGKFGGSLELIEHQTYSGAVANIDFTSIKENAYDVHLLVGKYSFGTADLVGFRFFEGGVLETASVYQVARQFNRASGTLSGTANSTGISDIFVGETTTQPQDIYIYIYNAGNSSKYTFTTQHLTTVNNSSVYFTSFGGAVLPQTSTVDGIRAFGRVSGNNFDDFDVKLYGVKQL